MDMFLAFLMGIWEPLSDDGRTILIRGRSNFVKHHAIINPKTHEAVYTVGYCLN